MCDEIMDDTTHTSYSRKFISPNRVDSDLLIERGKEKKN